MRYPLVETVKFKTDDRFAPFDMKTRGPKTLTKIVPTWSSEHDEVAKEFREVKEAARKRYGRA